MNSPPRNVDRHSSDGVDGLAPRRLPGLAAPLIIVLIGLGLYLPGLGWGLPATVSWSQDTIAGVRTLGVVESLPGDWRGRYPPLHYLILAGIYQPVLQHWERTGERMIDPATGLKAFKPPEAQKIGMLITIARLVSVAMAIAAGLGLWAAARLLTGDDVAALLAAVALLIGAAFSYFAHLGNVDVPSMCWFTWSLYFFARLLRSGRWHDALLLGLFGSFAISTKDAMAGAYPGMALVLLATETENRMKNMALGPALFRTFFQVKWLVGLMAFGLPYLFLYGAFSNLEAYVARMAYWLAPAAGTVHAEQHRYPNQFRLLLATIHYAGAAVGWPMLAAMAGAVVYALRQHRRTTLILLVPAVGYYLIVIAPIDFVYSRFLFPPIAFVCVIVGLAGAAIWRQRTWPVEVRLGLPGAVLLFSLGYAVAIDAEMLTDSRYEAERWFVEHVPRSAGIGAFSKPQYLPRLHELGYATYLVEMTRESFERPQPEYLIVSSYNYEDFDEDRQTCLQELLGGEFGYVPLAAFSGRYLGVGSHWLSLAGWGTPVPGKISPTITVLRHAAPPTETAP